MGGIKQEWKKGGEGLIRGELQRKSVGPKAQHKGRNKRKCSFRRPDTKCFCCYLVSLLAWGTSSGSTVPEDTRKQFLLCRTMFYYTSTADLIINYIRGFFFISEPREIHQLLEEVLDPGQVEGLVSLGFLTQNEALCNNSSASYACARWCSPLNGPAGQGSPRAGTGKQQLLQQVGSQELRSRALPPPTAESLRSPGSHSDTLLKTELGSQRVTFPTSAASIYL